MFLQWAIELVLLAEPGISCVIFIFCPTLYSYSAKYENNAVNYGLSVLRYEAVHVWLLLIMTSSRPQCPDEKIILFSYMLCGDLSVFIFML